MTIPIMLLTTFLSLNGQVVQTSVDSPEAVAYEAQTDVDIGDNTIDESAQSTVSGGDANLFYVEQNNDEVIALLNEQIELLAENSTTVTGTLNTSVLDLMDRMIDDLPSYYKYAGFRTSVDDAYQATLYLSKTATFANDVITFGDDCIAVRFYRNQYNNYNYYLTYDRYESPNSTVRINDNTIIYTNVVEGFPSLGNHQRFEIEYFWIGIFVILATVIFTRRLSNA